MADSIFKQHKLSLGIESGLELNDAQKRAFVANVKKISAQLQDSLDGAIREGISKDVIKDSMKDVVEQFNNEFKTLGIKTLDIDIDKIDIDDKPFKLIATQAAQNFTEAFKMSLNNSGIGDALSSEIIDSIDIVGGAVDKLFQRVEKRGKKSVAEIDSAIRKIKGNVNVKNADDETIRRKQLESEQKLAKRAEAVEKQLFGKVNVGKSSDKAIDNLKKTQESYLKAQNKGDWIKQYQDLLKFVQLYEGASKKFGEGFLAQVAELRDFYNALSSHKENATTSLRDFVSLSRGQGTFDDSKGPWARESTLKEIKNVLERKAGVKNTTSSAEGGYNNINFELFKSTETQLSRTIQSRIEAEERAKKTAEAIALVQEKMQKQGFAVYRGITEEDAMETRDEAKETYNAEYWAKDMATAISYALSSDDGFQTQLLKSIVNPKKPLILDAENHEYDDIRDMTALINTLEQLGMDIRALLGNGPMTPDEIQGVINNFAASKGFDAVITNNVKDANVDGSPITTTVAILDDSILSAIQAFDVVEGVLKSTATKIAEWYHAPDQSNAAKIGEVDEALEGELDRLRQEQAAAQKDIDKYAKQEEKQQKEIDKLKKQLPAQSNEGAEDKALTPSEGGDQGGIASSLDSESIQVLANAIKEVLTSQVGAADTNQDQPAKEVTLSKIHELLTSRLGTSSGKAPTGFVQQGKPVQGDANQRINVEADADTGAYATKPSSSPTEVKASINTEELGSLLNSITYNVKVVQDVEPAEGNKVSINADELRSVLDSITYNVKLAQGESDADSNKIAIDEGTLETVLNRITYNVKIAHDDADKTANKIAIDESALEQTLNRVFGNILSPKDDGKKTECKKEPWALESTLNTTIKDALDQIQSNTAKPESVEVAPAKPEVGNVLATETTLGAIKTAVESINSKVVKGTKVKTGEEKTNTGTKNSESFDKSRYFPEKLKTQTMQLAKFRAQLMTTGKLTDDVDAQIYELLDGLKQVQNGPDFSTWMQKFQQLKTLVGITDIFDKAESTEAAASYEQLIEFQKTRNKLELQYEKAEDGSALKQFYAEQLAQMDSVIAKQQEMLDNEEYETKLTKIQAEQARKLGELEAKAADKLTKEKLKEEAKLTKKQALTGKAGNAIGRAEGVWMEALSLDEDGIPQAFIERINKYNEQLDVLRKKHLEISNSKGPISKEQQKDLIAQTLEINKQTAELSELISEYQRLSGANTTAIGASTLGDSATISEYEQALKQAVMTATNGKAQIKNFDHDTRTLTYTLKTGKNEFTEYTAAVRHLDHQYTSTAGKTKRMETFLEATKRKMKELTSYFSGMAVFNRIGQELRRGIQYVREIDDALVELRKVTDETDESYDKFLRTAAKTGSVIGVTISEVTEATATFSKLGYDMEMATEMAESAIVYKNVGDNIASAEDAADSIISTLKGFRLESSETMRIVDRFNEVGKSIAHVI